MAMHGAKCRAVQQCIGALGGMPSEFDCFVRSWWSSADCPPSMDPSLLRIWKAGAIFIIYSDCPVEVEQEASPPAGAYYDVLQSRRSESFDLNPIGLIVPIREGYSAATLWQNRRLRGTPLLLFLDANASCDLSTLISVKGPGRTVACVDAPAGLRLRGRRGRCAPLPVAVHSLSRRTAGRCTHLALGDAQATAR